MTLWDTWALMIFGHDKDPGTELCGLKLSDVPLSIKTATLLFADAELLIVLALPHHFASET